MSEAFAYNYPPDEEARFEDERKNELAAQLEELLERLQPQKVTPSWINHSAPYDAHGERGKTSARKIGFRDW